jgi:hypothetical protein
MKVNIKNKKYIIINVLIIINVVYLLLYGYNKYIWTPRKITEYTNERILSAYSKELMFIPSVLELKYNDTVNNHTLKDVIGNDINISNNSNFYKYIYLMNIGKSNELKIDDLSYVIELNHQITEEYKSKIKFIIILVGDSSYTGDKKFGLIQNKLQVPIVYLKNDDVLKLYNISHWGCNYSILLDMENRVKYSYNPISIKYLRDIINRELQNKR